MQRELLHRCGSGNDAEEQPERLQGKEREQQLREFLPDPNHSELHSLMLDNTRSIMRSVNLNWG